MFIAFCEHLSKHYQHYHLLFPHTKLPVFSTPTLLTLLQHSLLVKIKHEVHKEFVFAKLVIFVLGKLS